MLLPALVSFGGGFDVSDSHDLSGIECLLDGDFDAFRNGESDNNGIEEFLRVGL